MIAGAAAGLLVHGAPRAAENPEPTQQPGATEGAQQGDVRDSGTGSSAQDAGTPVAAPGQGGDPSGASAGSGGGNIPAQVDRAMNSDAERAERHDAAQVAAGNTGGRG
jgi:hypothetical protein